MQNHHLHVARCTPPPSEKPAVESRCLLLSGHETVVCMHVENLAKDCDGSSASKLSTVQTRSLEFRSPEPTGRKKQVW
ncbi:hypothetical protein LEMLEM_LOCUS6282 [Lemmus lemmus]